MGHTKGMPFCCDSAHAESIIDDLHVHPIHADDLTERAVGCGAKGFGSDLQHLRHGSVPSLPLTDGISTTVLPTCKHLTVACQLELTLGVAQHHHLAASWQGSPDKR